MVAMFYVMIKVLAEYDKFKYGSDDDDVEDDMEEE